MNARVGRSVVLLTAILALCLGTAAMPQDEGPNLKPKAKPKPAGATLLVVCDLACDWKLDGEAQGRIEAGGVKKTPVSQGQHVVDAATADGLDKAEREVEIASIAQKVVRVELQPVREARLQEVRSRTDLQVQQGQDLYAQKRYQEARPLFQSACDGGSLPGCSWLGGLFLWGEGVTKDYNQARILFQRACDGGHMPACASLASLYERGAGVAQDTPRRARC